MREKVLVIEGKQSSSGEFAGPLAAAGFSVARVPWRPDMLLALEVLRPSIVLVDVTPPDEIESYHRVLGTLGVPVIVVCTDCGEKAGRGGLLEQYGDSCLRKPFSEADLIGTVTDMLRQRSRVREEQVRPE